jgi:16S rRNA G966 N2-methylase RsmD
VKTIYNWVLSQIKDDYTLNLFAGMIKLEGVKEVRIDSDKTMNADYYCDALDFLKSWNGNLFNIILLDPPYSIRKSMELYNGHKASHFNIIKDHIKNVINPNGKVITFGYNAINMGKIRGYELEEIALFSHGGARHDTIASVEKRIKWG